MTSLSSEKVFDFNWPSGTATGFFILCGEVFFVAVSFKGQFFNKNQLQGKPKLIRPYPYFLYDSWRSYSKSRLSHHPQNP
jgi:hypothetical protein